MRALQSLILSLIIVSCISLSSPLASAKKWFLAFNELDVLEVDNLTCDDERNYTQSVMQSITPYLSIFIPSWDGSGIQLDTTDIEFRILDKDTDYAIINVRGEMKRVAGSTLVTEDVDENLLMAREDNNWTWCGFTDMDTIDQLNVYEEEPTNRVQACDLEKYFQYYEAASYSLAKFRQEGYIPGKMLDPLALDNPETILLTGLIPGWFCVPERIGTCEMMLGISLRNLVPEFPDPQAGPFENLARQYKHERFFSEMQQNWDNMWLPYLFKNPSLSKAVKEFYLPENREHLCAQYAEDHPVK